jgi:hypothetical protein
MMPKLTCQKNDSTSIRMPYVTNVSDYDYRVYFIGLSTALYVTGAYL